MGSGLPGSLPSYLLYRLLLYMSYLANKIVVVVVACQKLWHVFETLCRYRTLECRRLIGLTVALEAPDSLTHINIKCNLYLQIPFLANSTPCKFNSLRSPFLTDSISLQILFLAISFPCRLKFIFPCIFRSFQIPHFAKNDHFPSICLSVQIHFLAK